MKFTSRCKREKVNRFKRVFKVFKCNQIITRNSLKALTSPGALAPPPSILVKYQPHTQDSC